MLAAEGERSAVVAFNGAADAHRTATEAARSRGDLKCAAQHLDLTRAGDLSAEALARAGN